MRLLGTYLVAVALLSCTAPQPSDPSGDGVTAGTASTSSGGSSGSGQAGAGAAGRAGIGGDDGPVAGDAALENPVMVSSGGAGGAAGEGGAGGAGGQGGGSSAPEPPEGTLCAGGFVDDQRHSAHCGACGNLCEPYVLARELSWPVGLAMNDTHAYWINSGSDATITRAALPHGEPEVLAPARPFPMDIELDAEHVYWAGDGSIWRMPLDGGEPMRLITDVQVNVQAIAVDASYVYAVTLGEESSAAVIKVDKAGGEPVTLASLTGMGPMSIAVDATHVYWANGSNTVDREVLKVPLEGGAPVTLSTGSSNVYSLAIDRESVYWIEHDDVAIGFGVVLESAVRKVPKAGGEVVTLASGTQQPMSLTIDSASAYWTNASNSLTFGATPGTDGVVQGVPLTGGDTLMIGPLQDEPTGIASNGTTVCWGTTGKGQDSGSIKCMGACSQGECLPVR